MVIKNTLLGGVDNTSGEFINAVNINDTNDAIINIGGFINKVHAPLGSITAWLKSYTNTPSLPIGWVECNGQTLSDVESPFDGLVIPNLNNSVGTGLKGYFLRGYEQDGETQTSTVLSHNHSVRQGGWHGGEGGSGYGHYSGNTGASGGTEMRPHNYSVVWIMRVK